MDKLKLNDGADSSIALRRFQVTAFTQSELRSAPPPRRIRTFAAP